MTVMFAEGRLSDSPFIEKIWRVEMEQAGTFISTAASHSEIVIAQCEGKTTVTVRGPETRATPAITAPDGECLGIVFRLGTFMPALLPKQLLDRRDTHLPVASGRSFWLDSTTWEIPNYDNVEAFVERLVREELLVHDPVVDAVLQGQPLTLSPRAQQYHFVRATGLSYKMIQQIERARQAAALLQGGIPIIDTVFELGYFDQAHLTNSLKRFLGQTPVQVAHTSQFEVQPE